MQSSEMCALPHAIGRTVLHGVLKYWSGSIVAGSHGLTLAQCQTPMRIAFSPSSATAGQMKEKKINIL